LHFHSVSEQGAFVINLWMKNFFSKNATKNQVSPHFGL
jgi:hypothetical protein